MEKRTFEHGFDLTATSILKMTLEPGNVWMPKTAGDDILEIVDVDKETGYVSCNIEGQPLLGRVLSISQLLSSHQPPALNLEYAGPIEYGATCENCKKDFEYQRKVNGFVCWACQNGY